MVDRPEVERVGPPCDGKSEGIVSGEWSPDAGAEIDHGVVIAEIPASTPYRPRGVVNIPHIDGRVGEVVKMGRGGHLIVSIIEECGRLAGMVGVADASEWGRWEVEEGTRTPT